MKPARIHRPGAPVTIEPPERLLAVVDSVDDDPQVTQCGVTTTRDGRWALYVTVQADADVPIASVEHGADGFPVVYEAELAEPVRARPAQPAPRRRKA